MTRRKVSSKKSTKKSAQKKKRSSVRRARRRPWQRVPFNYQLTVGDHTTSIVQRALKSVGARWSEKPVWIEGAGKYPGYFSGSVDMTGITEGKYATLMKKLGGVGTEIGQAWRAQWK